MKDTPPHLRALEEIEWAGIPGLLEMLHEAHKRQVEEVMDTLSEGPEGFYG